MHGDQHRRAGQGEIGWEVDAVQVDQVDGVAVQGGSRRSTDGCVRAGPVGGFDGDACEGRNGKESSGNDGAFVGDDKGSVAGPGESVVEGGEDLLGTADGIGANRGKRIGDLEDRQWVTIPLTPGFSREAGAGGAGEAWLVEVGQVSGQARRFTVA
jgi:hypothetical protein